MILHLPYIGGSIEIELTHYPSMLQREIPMACGTTTRRLTPEINPSLYARQTKHLTLKNLDSYLIPDG